MTERLQCLQTIAFRLGRVVTDVVDVIPKPAALLTLVSVASKHLLTDQQPGFATGV